jgi:hypothetical protein
MQRVTMVRYTTKPDQGATNEALSRAVFPQLKAAAPEGIAYALFRDGNEFIHVFAESRSRRGRFPDGVARLQGIPGGHRGALRRAPTGNPACRAIG